MDSVKIGKLENSVFDLTFRYLFKQLYINIRINIENTYILRPTFF